MNTIYNEEESKHSKMIKDLKNLPKIETPENFEYNLMTRIENKNFGNVEKEKPVFNWFKFLAPSAVVVTAIILLFIFLPSSQQIDNSPIYQSGKTDSPAVADNQSAEINGSANIPITSDNTASALPETPVAPNRAARNVNTRMPFGSSRSVSLDDYISGGNNPKNMQGGNIVSGGDASTPLDQFFIAERPDQNTLEKYRARLDSLKKAELRADSLKKVKKLP